MCESMAPRLVLGQRCTGRRSGPTLRCNTLQSPYRIWLRPLSVGLCLKSHAWMPSPHPDLTAPALLQNPHLQQPPETVAEATLPSIPTLSTLSRHRPPGDVSKCHREKDLVSQPRDDFREGAAKTESREVSPRPPSPLPCPCREPFAAINVQWTMWSLVHGALSCVNKVVKFQGQSSWDPRGSHPDIVAGGGARMGRVGGHS